MIGSVEETKKAKGYNQDKLRVYMATMFVGLLGVGQMLGFLLAS